MVLRSDIGGYRDDAESSGVISGVIRGDTASDEGFIKSWISRETDTELNLNG